MKTLISIALAYLSLGLASVTDGLGSNPVDRPLWAIRPTFGKVVMVAATWFVHPLFRRRGPGVSAARAFSFAFLEVTIQMTILTGFIWSCISVSDYIFDSTASRIATSAVLIIIGGRLILPWVNILMMPVTMIAALPLDFLFPLKAATGGREIKWCKTCTHYKNSKEYEEIPFGLYRSESMPRFDKLPCDIPSETSEVWKRYFLSSPDSRTLFPKDCPFFERR